MSLERRLLACVLLLTVAASLPLALLPLHVDLVLMPLGVTAGAMLITLVPSWRPIQFAAWLSGALLLLPCLFVDAQLVSIGVLAVVPLGTLVLTKRASAASLTAVVAVAVVAFQIGPTQMSELPALSWHSPADAAAVLFLWGGVAALLASPLFLRQARLRLTQLRATASALDDAIGRDGRWLEAVANVVADPTLTGPVRGAGLRPERLAVAARIDSHRVLLGWIEGPPLATMSAAWALIAAATGGQTRPRALLRLANEHLDEVLHEGTVGWLAVWDRHTGAIACTSRNAPPTLKRCVLTPRGPAEVAKPEAADAEAVIAELLPQPAALDAVHLSAGSSVAAGCLAVVAGAATLFPLPALGLAGILAALLAGHEIARRGARRAEEIVADAQAQLTDRTELHDDLRFQVAKLHGGLLPYRLRIGAIQATAHRLRGEVVDGSFADLVLDTEGTGHVLAGEIAGRGIAARFLGLAAQILARTFVEAGEIQPRCLYQKVVGQLSPLGRALHFPARLRLGAVLIERDGACQAYGTLQRIVAVRGVSDAPRTTPLAPTEIVQVTRSATIDDDTRVYLSPAPSLPGPEDDAPALGTVEAADRLADIVRSRGWDPREESLPSLFSLVFDGTAAPGHGTLVELSISPKEDDSGEDEDAEETQQRETAVAAAAV